VLSCGKQFVVVRATQRNKFACFSILKLQGLTVKLPYIVPHAGLIEIWDNWQS